MTRKTVSLCQKALSQCNPGIHCIQVCFWYNQSESKNQPCMPFLFSKANEHVKICFIQFYFKVIVIYKCCSEEHLRPLFSLFCPSDVFFVLPLSTKMLKRNTECNLCVMYNMFK